MKYPGHADTGFDMTPMIDVVMLLIVFFLVTSQFSQSIRTPIELPQQDGQSEDITNSAGDIVVDLLADGTIRLEGETLGADTFLSMVKSELLHGDPDTEVLIRPDRAGAAANLNRLCSRLSDAGVRAYRIATTPVPSESGR